MKKLLSLLLLLPLPISAQEIYSINANRLCANIVQIPYASDNFTDKEWNDFQRCLKYIRQFKENKK